MKKNRGVLYIIFLLVSFESYASSSAGLDLKATVPAIYDLQMTALNASTSLDILKGNKGTLVARTVETCNARDGYDVLASSQNNGELRNGDSTVVKTNYSMRYSSGTYKTLSTVPQVVYSISSLSKKTKKTQNINLNVTALPNAAAGTYSDLITFTIQAR